MNKNIKGNPAPEIIYQDGKQKRKKFWIGPSKCASKNCSRQHNITQGPFTWLLRFYDLSLPSFTTYMYGGALHCIVGRAELKH